MMDAATLTYVASVCRATNATVAERLQPLWGGYGEIVRVRLRGASVDSVVVKCVSPPPGRADAGHARKRRSYEVEGAFYRAQAERCDDRCRVPKALGARRAGGRWEWLLVLEDLAAAGFSGRVRGRDLSSLDPCLRWLAAFHARFLGAAPSGLWPIGTYWHLSTRQEELARTTDARLRTLAPELDAALRGAKHQTLVHGDAKPENFCLDPASHRVAAVDFQYVGGGPGIKDVAYLLYDVGSSEGRARALDLYFTHLRAALASDPRGPEVEAEWRGLYPAAVDDFRRFLAGWAG